MEYVNPETGLKIDLSGLNEAEMGFYRRALKEFQKNVNWLEFDHFVLGRNSVLYDGKRSHFEVLKHPLYLAVKDMWIQLGIQQGMVAKRKMVKEQEALA
jgi:hypothetical protein